MDEYLTWQNILEQEPEQAQKSFSSMPAEEEKTVTEADSIFPVTEGKKLDHGLPAGITLPESLQKLLDEKKRLEKEIRILAGQEEWGSHDERSEKMYPREVHTPQSRIDERRRKREEESARIRAKRTMELQRIQQRIEEKQQQLKEKLLKNRILEAVIRENKKKREEYTLSRAAEETAKKERIQESIKNRRDQARDEEARKERVLSQSQTIRQGSCKKERENYALSKAKAGKEAAKKERFEDSIKSRRDRARDEEVRKERVLSQSETRKQIKDYDGEGLLRTRKKQKPQPDTKQERLRQKAVDSILQQRQKERFCQKRREEKALEARFNR